MKPCEFGMGITFSPPPSMTLEHACVHRTLRINDLSFIKNKENTLQGNDGEEALQSLRYKNLLPKCPDANLGLKFYELALVLRGASFLCSFVSLCVCVKVYTSVCCTYVCVCVYVCLRLFAHMQRPEISFGSHYYFFFF